VKGVRGVRLTTSVRSVPKLITNSAMSLPSYMPAWLGKGQIDLYLYLYSDMLSIVLQILPLVQRFQKTRCGFPRFKIILSLRVLRLQLEHLHTGMVHSKACINTGQIIFRQPPGHHNLNEDTWKIYTRLNFYRSMEGELRDSAALSRSAWPDWTSQLWRDCLVIVGLYIGAPVFITRSQ